MHYTIRKIDGHIWNGSIPQRKVVGVFVCAEELSIDNTVKSEFLDLIVR